MFTQCLLSWRNSKCFTSDLANYTTIFTPSSPLRLKTECNWQGFPFGFQCSMTISLGHCCYFFVLIVNLIAWEKKAALFSRTAARIQSIFGVKKEKENFHVTSTQKCQFCFPKGEKIQKTPHEENIECFICCEIKSFFNVF